MPDELFTPTIRERPVGRKAPWRPQSIIYPAFFGGPLAAATLGVFNGRRLAIPPVQLWLIGAAGVIGFAVRFAVAAAYDGTSVVRLAGSIAGASVWLVVLAFQRRPFRAFDYAGGEPAGLTGPGFAAFLGCGVLEAVLIFTLAR